MFTTLFRIIKYGLQGFWRNGWLSAATIAIVLLVLIGFGGLLIFSSFTNLILNEVQDKIDISVYFKAEAPEDQILQLQKSLESLAEVKAVEYVSRDQALEKFKAQHKEDALISQSIEELGSNPLSASFNVKARDLKEYPLIAAYLSKDVFKGVIDKVSYTENAIVIERLKKIKNTVEQGGLFLMLFITITAALIIFNTIRLAIYSNREEIGIMRLVGGSNFLIRGPYMVEGMLYGLFGSLLSVLFVSVVVYYLAPYSRIFIPGINSWNYYSSSILALLGYQLLFGIGLGMISSYIAVRKYLKI